MVNHLLTISIKVNLLSVRRIELAMGSIGNEKGTDGPGVLELAHGVRLDQHRRKRLEIASGSGLEPEFNALERSPKGGRFCFMGAVLPVSELRRPRGYRR